MENINIDESLKRIKKGIIDIFKEFNSCNTQEQVATLNRYISDGIKDARNRYRNTRKFIDLKFDSLKLHLIDISQCGKEKQTAFINYIFWIGYESINNTFDIFLTSFESSDYTEFESENVADRLDEIIDNTFVPFSLKDESGKIDDGKLKSIRESLMYFLNEKESLNINEICENLLKNSEIVKIQKDKFNDVCEYLDSKNLFKETTSFSSLDYKKNLKEILLNNFNYLFNKDEYKLDIGFNMNDFDFLGFVYIVYFIGSFVKDIQQYCYSVLHSTNIDVFEYDLATFKKLEKQYKKENTTILKTRLETDINTANIDYIEFSDQNKGELFNIINLFENDELSDDNTENVVIETINLGSEGMI
ncbi:hypothetical protein ACF3OI_10250 (plasmid) [Finegoldia magna]|uniref:hypothetical protein n=1 Tax=Finegoldia magna TaxID=1260 RepID=UPI00370D50D8